MCSRNTGQKIAHDRPAQNGTGAGTDTLQGAKRNQPLDARRKRAADTGESKQCQPEIEWLLAADHVGHGSIDQLRQAHGDEEGNQAGLHGAVVGIQCVADFRQRGQIHVDGKEADRGQETEHDRQRSSCFFRHQEIAFASPGQGASGEDHKRKGVWC